MVEVQQQKGLHQQSVGYFSFPCKAQLETTAQFFHCGKPIGEVAIEAAVFVFLIHLLPHSISH